MIDSKIKREAELGYREISGKEVRLREWGYRREAKDFRALVSRLNARRWQRRVYAEGGSKLDALRRYRREWAARKLAQRGPLPARTVTCAGCGWTFEQAPRGRPQIWCSPQCEKRSKYRDQLRVAPVVHVCQVCGVEWCSVVWASGRASKTCSDTCRRVHVNKRKRIWRAS